MTLGPPKVSLDETADATASRPEHLHLRDALRSAARLVGVYPAGFNACVDLGSAPVTLGRSPQDPASCPIHDARLSRDHLLVEWDEAKQAHVATDLGSKNGSWVGRYEARGGWHVLRPGAVVRIADRIFVYERGHTLETEDGPRISRVAVPGRALGVAGLRARMELAAPDVAPALILGETGTGKELTARELHVASGRRGDFVPVNCATFSEQLVESQLFGHVKGAFTGASTDSPGLFRAAEGGTLFLDEIGELPLELQPKLLRAIQEREIRPVGGTRTERVDVRVVTATHRDLRAMVAEGRFRQDLYARLALWELAVPPLRDRKVDLLRWVELLYRRWAEERGRAATPPELEVEAAHQLLLEAWPENLRGLSRLVHELARRELATVGARDLPGWVGGAG